MTTEMIFSTINLVLLIAYVVYQKFILNKVSGDSITAVTETVDTMYDLYQKFNIITDMAKKFVILAKTTFKDSSGEEKRDWVIEQLGKTCKMVDLVLTDEELKAINESAYDEMCKEDSLYESNNK